MPGFVKPTRKVVNIEDAFGELIGKKLIKDLHDNEEICPVCHGTGLRIEDNPYGLSDDPDKRAGQFPYKHQSIRFCPNCYNGVVRFCPDCGKQIPRCRTLCDCDAVVQRRQQEENRKEKERLEKAEKHEPDALGSLFTMAQSDFYPHNEGYFSCWEDFFDSWNEDCEEFTEKPLYVWGTEEVEMSFDASSIVSDACEDMYEDAYARMGEPTWNPAVLDFTESRLDDLVKECGLHAVTIHPVVSTMMPRSNNNLSSYLKHWCEIKNTQRNGEAGLQLSINSTSDDQREAQFADKSLSLREIANIASDLPMPVGRKYTLNFAVTEATILDAKVLDSLFDRNKFIVKITPIHQTKTALEHNYDITTSYDDYSVYDKFEQPLLDLGWDVIVFVPSKEEDSDRITCGNALISEV